MRTVVAFCGAAGSGKDAAASVLIERGYAKRSFAEDLRHEVRSALVIPEYRSSVWRLMPFALQRALFACLTLGELDPWAKPTSPRMRRVLQLWGTEFRRAQDPDYWVRAEAASLPTHGRFVYTDVRFPNEERFMRQLGAAVYRVERSGVEGNGHVSESYFRAFDVAGVIQNNGSLRDLRREVERVTEGGCQESVAA